MADSVRPRSLAPFHSRFQLKRLSAAIVVSSSILLVANSTAYGQSENSSVDQIVKLRLDWLAQVARKDACTWESELISAPRSSGSSVGSLGDPGIVLNEFRSALANDYDVIRSDVSGLAAKVNARGDEAQKDWSEICRQRTAFRHYADGQQAIYGFDFDSGTPLSFHPRTADAAMLLWTAISLALAVRLRFKERRLAMRRARRAAGFAAVLVGTLALPGCNSDLGSGRWVDRERSNLSSAIKDAAEKADTAMEAANAKWQAAVDGWARLVASPTDSVDALVQREEVGEGDRGGLRDRLRAIAVESRFAELMLRDAEEQGNKLTEERSKLEELVSGAKWRSIALGCLRIGCAVVLFGLAIAPYWLARRERRAAVRLASRTCPRCFRRDTLKLEKTASSAESKPRYRGSRAKAYEVVEEEEAPIDGEVRCTRCGLRMRKSYSKVPRLCFPTVGVRSSGKTHMMVTAYNRIRKRSVPTAATVQPAPSGSDIDARFDRLIDEIMFRRGEAGATDLALPDPILVHLKDCDPAGGNPALINLFDYSGELINPEVDVNQLKATAVRMDGFMLFLDPTQLYGDGANVTLDEQLGMLDRFLEHMRRERQVPVGEAIPVPVAVCIPKFDLLINENPIGGQSVPFIRQLLDELNPPPREVTLETIRARSLLVEEMLPLMFTGTDVREIVEGYFGKQVMFFPMSSVGLFERELGIKDLAHRTIAPFGVAEPVIWLTHMHGYEVFG